MQSLLGTIPTEFTDYWISRFPRLLSHSYHALEACSKENSFLPYYSKTYIFAKPDYFYEQTEDFVPTEMPKIVRDSPKKYNNRYNNKYNYERRPSPQDIENIGPNANFRNFGRPPPGFDNFAKPKKGAYNFHRNVGSDMPNQPLQYSQAAAVQPGQSFAQQVQQPQLLVPPPAPEPKYVEDDDGFLMVKPKQNGNVRNRKPDGQNKVNTNNGDVPIAWTLPK